MCFTSASFIAIRDQGVQKLEPTHFALSNFSWFKAKVIPATVSTHNIKFV